MAKTDKRQNELQACHPLRASGNLLVLESKSFRMDTNRQPESDDAKLRELLEEFLRRARHLETFTQAPANLPRVKEPSRPPLPLH